MTKSVSTLTIHLMGSPTVERSSGLGKRPRGNKVWGLLVFLALTGTNQPRHVLTGRCFPRQTIRSGRWDGTPRRCAVCSAPMPLWRVNSETGRPTNIVRSNTCPAQSGAPLRYGQPYQYSS